MAHFYTWSVSMYELRSARLASLRSVQGAAGSRPRLGLRWASATGACRPLAPLKRLFLPAPYSTEKEKNPLPFGEKLLSAQSTPTQCVVNFGENVNALKSSILEKVPWKNLRSCNQRERLYPSGPPKKFRKPQAQLKIFEAWFSLPMAASPSANHGPKP